MNNTVRKIITIVLSLVFVCCLGQMAYIGIQYYQAEQARAQAQELLQTMPPDTEPSTPAATEPSDATEPTETEPPVTRPTIQQEPLEKNAEFLLDMDYSGLKEKNEDVIGWVYIPDTKVDYPILRSYDNQDYLNHAWDGSYSFSGSIFLECKNNRNFLDYNTILYGHHMLNGTYFAAVADYKHADFQKAHPYVYVLTDNDLRRYEVFSTYEAPVQSDAYRLYFPDDATKQAALDYYMEKSVMADKGNLQMPTVDDYILTCSTCTGVANYQNRWVIHARLTGIWIR